MRPLSYAKTSRLLKPSHFQSVFDSVDCKQGGAHFTLLARLQADPQTSSVSDDPEKPASLCIKTSRLGIIVSKRNVPTAVGRNYIKRITRETFRQNVLSRTELPRFDVIVLAKSSCSQLAKQNAAVLLTEQWNKLLNKIESGG